MNNRQYQGLTDLEVLQSRERHGRNILTPPEKESLFRKFLAKFSDPLIRIIMVAGLLLLSTAYLVDGSFNPFLYFRF